MSDHICRSSHTVCLHRPNGQTTPAQPTLLDLFCGEGGSALGYQAAGFTVTGVDHLRARRLHYPGTFVHADALEYLAEHGHEYDVIHASPPCQAYSITRHSHKVEHPDLVAATRTGLAASRRPWVIENVVGAPLDHPITLCGSYFNLTAVDDDGTRLVLRRHRLFESNVWLNPSPCYCLAYKDRRYKVGGAYGGGSQTRAKAKVRRGGYTPPKHVRAALLGVPGDSMTWDGLSQAVPPAFTAYIGEQLRDHLDWPEPDGLHPPGHTPPLWED